MDCRHSTMGFPASKEHSFMGTREEPELSSSKLKEAGGLAAATGRPSPNAAHATDRAYYSAPACLCIADRDLRCLTANRMFAGLCGRPDEDLAGLDLARLVPWAAAAMAEQLAAAYAGAAPVPAVIERPEVAATFLMSAQPLREPTGLVSGISLAFVDITGRHLAQTTTPVEQRTRFALDSAGQWIWELDIAENRVWRSPGWKAILGFKEDELTVEDEYAAWRIVHPDDMPAVDRALRNVTSGRRRSFEATYRLRHKSGRWLWILSRGKVVEHAADGAPLRLLATSVDISRQKRTEEELAATVRQRRLLEQELISANRRLTTLSEMDPLTELPNRRKFDALLEHEFRRAEHQSPSLALLMIDVDRFKNFNDLYGHPDGDECLRRVAECLRLTVQRSGDTVTRYGGEEFAAILTDADEAAALALAARIRDNIRAMQIPHAGSSFNIVTVSIGVTAFGLDVGDDRPRASERLRAADRALYAAKNAGRDRIALARIGPEGAILTTLSSEPTAANSEPDADRPALELPA
ncbi:MAG TPA: diguanylate cyclase [Xanthobacteraceae bacterium]|nr:diguanylate cyclase [Xanthobacteraceae bacterium]